MSIQAPLRLLELAGQSLLRDQALAISAVEELPRVLYLPLFMEAFSRRQFQTLTVMVQAWPFTCLPLGSLMKTLHLEPLKALLEGLHMLLTQKDRPRRWKLQVLDLRDVDENFWAIWSESRALSYSTEAMSKRQTAEDCPRTGEHQPLKVFIDICLKEIPQDECLRYLFQWVYQRRGLVHLCCRKLVNYLTPIKYLRKSLKIIYLNSIEELEIHNTCWPHLIRKLRCYLKEMKTLGKLVFSRCHHYTSDNELQGWLVAKFSSVFLRLEHLQLLKIKLITFFSGHLEQLIRCLQNPLENLELTCGNLLEEDVKCLSQYPSLGYLKHLNLSYVLLFRISLEPLGALPEKIAASLETLVLEGCQIHYSQLSAILPGLSHCSQLTTFYFGRNCMSVDALKDLLRHTSGLSKLSLETYPAPEESLNSLVRINWEIFTPLRAELMYTLREVRQPKRIFIGPTPCPSCGSSPSEELELHLCC
ncbi:PRAME family member 2 isoform X1 [Gorilla gorilla gorilla]|uniref:PRAME family member 2 isoform X1 n=1 Tax=Gorilla gorilla gorilla TaxID=9595 RepID=UPI0030098311